MPRSTLVQLRLAVVLFAWIAVMAFPARAQVGLGLGVSISPARPVRSETVVFQLSLTNLNTILQSGVVLTNTLDPSLTFVGTSTNVVSVTNRSGVLEFVLPNLEVGQFFSLSVTGVPMRIGLITNVATAASVDVRAISVTNVPTVVNRQSDLSVRATLAETEPLTGQLLNYRVTVTNLGPDTVDAVVVSNAIPAGTEFVALATPGIVVIPTNGVIRFQAGTLAAGAGSEFTVTIRTVAAGTLAVTATVLPTENDDTVTSNNVASASVEVTRVVAGSLRWTGLDSGELDPQTGLIRHRYRVTNTGTNTVPGVRVFVSGLTNAPSNIAGTNTGRRFVTLLSPIGPSESAEFFLEYFSPARVPIPELRLVLDPIPIVPVLPPATVLAGVAVDRVRFLPAGSLLLEFPTVAGRTYRIVYGESASFSDAHASRPDLVAGGTRLQWIDAGLPRTASAPGVAPARFYRVQEVSR